MSNCNLYIPARVAKEVFLSRNQQSPFIARLLIRHPTQRSQIDFRVELASPLVSPWRLCPHCHIGYLKS